ncbi:piggyBac transposable element-derived protein 4-like [Onthophagus taurus]|uniref:piggyBac transposable element-derived protein 4-like n=1 Tax=Onthophagus taurus TaxID=166361 RepID=UPI0039BDC5DD
MASKRNVKSVKFGDPGYEKILVQWVAECEDLPSEESDVSEAENDDTEDRNLELVPDEYSGSSSDRGDDNSEDDVDDIGKPSTSGYIAPSGLVWSLEPPAKNKIQPHNIIRRAPGLARKHMAATPKKAFQLFVTPVIVQEIVNCTNLEGKRVYGATGKPWKDVTVDEFLAFCGLLIHAGVDRGWDVPVYRARNIPAIFQPHSQPSMSIFRFEEIRRFVRFDDKRTRNARLETDKLAMVSYIWDLFIQQCKTCVIPDTNVTIDEQLVGFRGRCTFVQYMPSKLAKYGLKIFWMCESTSGYALDGLVYVGPHKNLGLEVVQTLVRGIHNSGRNLTIDNFFTSVPLATYLLDKNITVVGTLRQNKSDIPKEMKASKDRVVYSSLFCFQNNVSMVSYARKKNKCVILLSTMHHDASINDDAKRKPEIISHYNKTKGGVDIMDQMVSTYTCKRQSKGWPMTFFFNIIDVATLNA